MLFSPLALSLALLFPLLLCSSHIRVLTSPSARDSSQKMAEEHPDVDVFTCSMDPILNERGYIVPGVESSSSFFLCPPLFFSFSHSSVSHLGEKNASPQLGDAGDRLMNTL